jgi:hypothetical protein
LCSGRAVRADFGNKDAISGFFSIASRFHPIFDHGLAGETNTRLRILDGINPAKITAVDPP